jgi:hypothetical protein
MNPLPLAFIALALATTAAAQPAPVAVPLDAEVTLNGVGFACTGVGQTRHDPKWLTWPLRVEFSNQRRDLLTDGAVAVVDGAGHDLAAVTCEAPWILVRPSPAARSVAGWLPGQGGKRHSAAIGKVGGAQRTIELTFTAE